MKNQALKRKARPDDGPVLSRLREAAVAAAASLDMTHLVGQQIGRCSERLRGLSSQVSGLALLSGTELKYWECAEVLINQTIENLEIVRSVIREQRSEWATEEQAALDS